MNLCLWNTLGNVKDEVKVLQKLKNITKKSIFITAYHKGTLTDRKEWYKRVGVTISKIDVDKEIFYSESGLKSKSYSLKDIQKIAKAAHLQIRNFKMMGGVMLWGELVH